MSELTREQVNEEIRTIVGSFDIERFDEVKRCREAIMAHDAAQRAQREQDRQRIQELEAKYAHELAEVNRQKELDLASECDRLKQRLTALEQERRKDAVDGQGALEERDEQIRTLTQALAQARGALKAVLEQWINGRKVKDGMSLTLRLHIESLLDVPAAGGGDVREAAKKYLGELQNNIAATGGYYLYPDKALADLEALIASCKPAAPAPPLVWTTTRPTVKGYYWFQRMDLPPGVGEPAVLHVTEKNGALFIYELEEWCPLWQYDGHWAGPLQEPKGA